MQGEIKMNSQNIIFVIIGCILVGIGAILLFIFKSPASH